MFDMLSSLALPSTIFFLHVFSGLAIASANIFTFSISFQYFFYVINKLELASFTVLGV